MITAKIISETSAGGLWIEIWWNQRVNGNDTLLYSHDYFREGATEQQYRDLLAQAKADAEGCLQWGDYDGCDVADDGEIPQPSQMPTAFVVAEFCRVNATAPGTWEIDETNDKLRFVRDFLDLIA